MFCRKEDGVLRVMEIDQVKADKTESFCLHRFEIESVWINKILVILRFYDMYMYIYNNILSPASAKVAYPQPKTSQSWSHNKDTDK